MRTATLIAPVLLFLVAAQAQAEQVTCESVDQQRKECEMNTRGEVRLVRQLSKSPCQEGVSWGLSKHAVWVEGGCRGVFESAGPAGGVDAPPAQDGPPDSAVRGCNAVEDRYGEVVSSSRLKPGWWEIILRYDDGQYVCNVSESGKVSEYKKQQR